MAGAWIAGGQLPNRVLAVDFCRCSIFFFDTKSKISPGQTDQQVFLFGLNDTVIV